MKYANKPLIGFVLVANQVLLIGSDLMSCSKVPLVNAAWRRLPPKQRFPCDSEHLVVISDYTTFLQIHPEIGSNEALREKGLQAIAFSPGSWPVYVNLDRHQALLDRFNRGEYWVAYVMAGVLAHERVHAMGNLSESAGLLEELRLDRRFRLEGKLPETFDLDKLEQQYWEALSEEGKSVSPKKPAPARR